MKPKVLPSPIIVPAYQIIWEKYLSFLPQYTWYAIAAFIAGFFFREVYYWWAQKQRDAVMNTMLKMLNDMSERNQSKFMEMHKITKDIELESYIEIKKVDKSLDDVHHKLDRILAHHDKRISALEDRLDRLDQ